MDEKQELKLNVAYTPDVAKGVFANLAIVSTVGDECRLDFLYVDRAAQDDSGAQDGYLVSRVLVPPSQLAAIRDMISNHLGDAE